MNRLQHLLQTGGRTAADLLMTLLPHGGQRGARRNAWAGMSADAAVGRARREAEQAVPLAGGRIDRRDTGTAPSR